MTKRKIPIIPTIVVVAAAAVMVALGFWQLARADEKEALIARYETAENTAPFATIPDMPADSLLFRRATVQCGEVLQWSAIAGRNDRDQSGYVHVAQCRNGLSGTVQDIVAGWSRNPAQDVAWTGGEVTGTIAPGGENGWRLVADPPIADLAANAAPDPNDLPNNHLAYAGQWFFFALTALVIYGFALRRRWREQG